MTTILKYMHELIFVKVCAPEDNIPTSQSIELSTVIGDHDCDGCFHEMFVNDAANQISFKNDSSFRVNLMNPLHALVKKKLW